MTLQRRSFTESSNWQEPSKGNWSKEQCPTRWGPLRSQGRWWEWSLKRIRCVQESVLKLVCINLVEWQCPSAVKSASASGRRSKTSPKCWVQWSMSLCFEHWHTRASRIWRHIAPARSSMAWRISRILVRRCPTCWRFTKFSVNYRALNWRGSAMRTMWRQVCSVRRRNWGWKYR
jgi:hypothetical protein